MSYHSERQRHHGPRRRFLKWGLGTLAGLIILAALLVGLFRVAANMIPGYHDAIARQISTKVGAPVTLGRISLAWHGWGPELQFDKLRIANPDTGKTVLSAKRLRLDFTLLSVVNGSGARPYAIALVAPRVTLQQKPDGRVVIPGLSLPGGTGQLGSMLGEQIRITRGRITLRPAGSGKKTWHFAPVKLRVGGGKRHAVKLALPLPAELGGHTLLVGGTVKTPSVEFDNWQWQLHYSLDKLALGPLKRFVPREWSGLRGRTSVAGNARGTGLSLSRASGRLKWHRPGAGPNALSALRAHYAIAAARGIDLTLSRLAVKTRSHTWTPGRIRIGRGKHERIDVAIARLDLSLLSHLEGVLPDSLDDLAKRLHTMQPGGRIEDFRLALSPANASDWRTTLALSARLDDVGALPAAGVPGFSHVSGEVSMTHGMGIFKLDAPGLTVRMPHIFGHPVKVEQAKGRIGIALTDAGIRVATPGLDLEGAAGLDGRAMAKIDVPRDGPVTVYVAAEQLGMMDTVAARGRYFPAALLSRPLVDWMMNQLDGGKVGGARLRFGGQVKRFPFYHGGGYFSVKFGFHDVTLQPREGWEPLHELSGSVHFLNAGMRAQVDGGKIVDARVNHADVSIPDLANPRLEVHTEVTGQVADFMTFLKNSPVGEDVAFGFSQFDTHGRAITRLKLDIPILHVDQFNLSGNFSLHDVKLEYIGRPYQLRHLSGNVKFDRHGPLAGHVAGELFDTPVAIDISRTRQTNGAYMTTIGMNGDFPLKTLSEAFDYDFGSFAHGHLPLHAQVELPLTGKGLPLDIELDSSLEGLELKLPAPVGKSALAAMPFTAHVHVKRHAIGLRARYADVGALCATIVHAAHGSHARSAEIRLGQGECSMPASGYRVVGGWPVVKLGQWLQVARPAPAAESSAAATPDAAASTVDKTSKAGFWPQKNVNINVRFDKLSLFGERLHDQSIRGALDRRALRLLLEGPDLAGKVRVPRRPSNHDPILVKLAHGRFAVKKGGASEAPNAATATAPAPASSREATVAEGGGESRWEPRDIPPFSLHAAHLKLGEASFDNVTVSARRVPHGIAVKPIHVGGGTLSLDGQLVWLHSANNMQGALQLLAHIHDLGQLLKGLGIGDQATGHGSLSAALAWQKPSEGGQFAQGLLGKVSMDLREGNISRVSPGAGRLLSLLNLVNIPRYLVLDFHNLFGEGFPFSRIYGDYHIKNGIAHTDAFRIDSSVADIKLSGDINLVAGTMDQTAEVRPNYFGSLPVIGALVGGLGVGAAVFVLAEIFGNPIGKALELTYHIHGPITNPIMGESGEKKQQAHPASPSGNAHAR